MKAELNKSYRIYGKMGKMKNMKPVSKDRFVTNLIRADIYNVNNEDDLSKLNREIDFLQSQGKFELREC